MSSVIFSGPLLRALKSAIRLNDQATIWSGSADPTVTPTFGRQGDLYIKFGASPAFYQKTTADGTDTNWTQGAPLAPNSISGAEIRLDNDEQLRARNAANNGDVDILKVNSSDRILFASLPQVASDPVAGNDLARLSYISTQLGLKVDDTEKGANNGVATLDAGGKVPVSQLPASVMTYEGTWNATTNTPTLADGTGSAGQIYLVDTAGTQNLGSGAITFAIGDWAVHNGTIWQKSLNSNAVVSVNSQNGVVVLVTDDIAEDGSPTNLWFTDERAQDAVGGILANTTTINLSYSDGTPSISAVVNASSLTNTEISGSAAIAYSKLNLSSSIVNADVATAAAIAVNKLAAVTASKAVASDSSGFLVAASTTAAELDYVSGVTSAIQTQLNAKQATGNYITALTGDVTAAGPGSSTAAIAASVVTGKLITGYVSGAGTVAATDTILQAINKLDGNDGLNLKIANNLSDLNNASTARTNLVLGNVNNTSDANKPISIASMVSNSTGTITGGVLSVGAPNTTFSITDGTGMVVDNTVTPATLTQVSWTGKTNITATYVAAGLVSYVAIDNTGAVVQQLAQFTNTQFRQYIVLGSLIHVNLTNLDAVNQQSEVLISPLNQLNDLNDALGPFNLSGNIFQANGANLNLNKTVGKIFSRGSNWGANTSDPNVVPLSSLTALSFQYRFSTGTNGATGTSVNPDIYDVAGVSTAVPANKVTIQRIYSFVSNNVKIQPGQAYYTNIAEAKSALQTEVFVTEPSIATNGILRGFMIVKQGSTALNSATNAFFYEAGKFSGQTGIGGQSVSSLQNAYDNSSDPEILTDATRGAVSIKRGSAADTDNILEGINAADSVTFSVTGAGVITGSNLSGANTGDQTITLTGDITGSGTGSFATAYAGIVPMNKGGTNKNMTASAGAVVYSDADSLELTAVGTSGQVLQSNGTSAPSWATVTAAIPTIFGSRGTPRSVVAATGITSGASHMSTTATAQDIYIEGSITGDSIAATISAGTIDGQRMTLLGRTDTKTVTLDSTTTNVALNGPITMGAGDVINLRFDGTNWQELSRS